jgi:hypothetical protein
MPTRVSKRQAAKGPVKVKQSTINAIKKTGMSKALGNITPAQRKNAAYMTGLKRMYGAARVNKALGSGNRAVPVGGVMGTKRAQVMAGPVRSTMKKTATKSTPAKKTTPKKTTTRSTGAVQQALAARAPKSKMFSNLGAGVSVPRNYKKK